MALSNWLSQILSPRSQEDRKFADAVAALTGRTPGNLELYRLAVRHSSAGTGKVDHNERLEFLGDAVLGTIIAELLFKRFPTKDEGFLTEIRSRMVNGEALGTLATKIGLQDLIKYEGRRKQEHTHRSMHGDAMEALIGAFFLDHGFEACKRFILDKLVKPHYDIDEVVESDNNHKSRLIEWAQKNGMRLSFDMGHERSKGGEKEFVATVLLDGKPFATGSGFSKKKAEQSAADNALKRMRDRVLGIERAEERPDRRDDRRRGDRVEAPSGRGESGRGDRERRPEREEPRPARPEREERPDRGDRPERGERRERPDRADRPVSRGEYDVYQQEPPPAPAERPMRSEGLAVDSDDVDANRPALRGPRPSRNDTAPQGVPAAQSQPQPEAGDEPKPQEARPARDDRNRRGLRQEPQNRLVQATDPTEGNVEGQGAEEAAPPAAPAAEERRGRGPRRRPDRREPAADAAEAQAPGLSDEGRIWQGEEQSAFPEGNTGEPAQSDAPAIADAEVTVPQSWHQAQPDETHPHAEESSSNPAQDAAPVEAAPAKPSTPFQVNRNKIKPKAVEVSPVSADPAAEQTSPAPQQDAETVANWDTEFAQVEQSAGSQAAPEAQDASGQDAAPDQTQQNNQEEGQGATPSA